MPAPVARFKVVQASDSQPVTIEAKATYFCGVIERSDGLNDVTVGVYNGTAVSVTEEVGPSQETTASYKGRNGFNTGGIWVDCPDGLCANVTGTNGRCTVYYW